MSDEVRKPYPQEPKKPEMGSELSPVEVIDDSAHPYSSAAQSDSYKEDDGSESRSLLDKFSGPVMILFYLAYLAYGIVGLGMFGSFVCWLIDIDNFILECLAIGSCLIAFSAIPFAGWVILGGIAYYAAEVLHWGWLWAILFVFPGIGFMLLTGLGSLASIAIGKLRR